MEYGSDVVEDAFVSESENGEAACFEDAVTICISFDLRGSVVRRAIALHDELGFFSIEVANVVGNAMLTAEFGAAELSIT